MPAKTKSSSSAKKNIRSRVRKYPSYKSFKLARKIKNPSKGSLLPSRKLISQSLKLIFSNKKIFLGLLIIYLLLVIVMVRGLSLSSEFVETKQSVDELLGEQIGSLAVAIGLFTVAISSASPQAGEVTGAYQLFFILIISLATIWSARQLMAGEKIRLRDSFYRGMYPLIPFMLVVVVIALQLIPFLIGNLLFSTVVANELAVTLFETMIWLSVFLLLALLSVYMVTSSVFALYIAALPDMAPIKALRSARQLVLHRRIGVIWRIAVAMLFLFLLSAVLIIPLIIVASWSVEWVVLALGGFGLIFWHVYMYLLYRSML